MRRLNGVFNSQIAGGKRYDLATPGRRAGNATFFESHATNKANQWVFGMDLTPLMMDDSREIGDYVANFIKVLVSDVRGKLTTRLSI